MAAPSQQRQLWLTFGAATTTIVVVGGVLAGPTIMSCLDSPAGLLACMRQDVVEAGLLPSGDPQSTSDAPRGVPQTPAVVPTGGASTPAGLAGDNPSTDITITPKPLIVASNPNAIPVGDPDPQPDPVPAAEAASEQIAEPAPVPVTEPAPLQPVQHAAVEPGPEPEPAPAPIPIREPALAPAPEPAPVAEPAPVDVAEPVASPAPRPITKAMPSPAREPDLAVEPKRIEAPPQPPIQVAETEPEPAPPAVPSPTPAPKAPPTIDAIEIDGDANFFAGAGPEGATIRLYIDDRFIADAKVVGGRWLVEAYGALTLALQRVRIDLLWANTAQVAAHAEVNFAIDLPSDGTVAPEAGGSVTPGASATSDPALSTAPAVEPQVEDEVSAVAPTEPDIPTITASPTADLEMLRFASGKAIIRRGENLWGIARRVYGDGTRYTAIFEANRDQMRSPEHIFPGQVFNLPKVQEDGGVN